MLVTREVDSFEEVIGLLLEEANKINGPVLVRCSELAGHKKGFSVESENGDTQILVVSQFKNIAKNQNARFLLGETDEIFLAAAYLMQTVIDQLRKSKNQ